MREQAEELAIQSSNLADALATRKALPSIEPGYGRRRATRQPWRRFFGGSTIIRPIGGRRGGCTAARELGRLLVSKVLGLALGILAAIGGFVDIGDLVFNVVGGSDLRLPADVGDTDRCRRDHRLLGDVRACGRRLGESSVRRGA